ncbi:MULTISPECIES: ThuA domain-containing protein [Mumia]|uniref:ThuA domain-containing protein n=1 Tax=Mumia TaxID=1546255 RepID=UPI001AB02AFA|nr:ThuA domain-containing protein [Mumia sp. ZJ1417]
MSVPMTRSAVVYSGGVTHDFVTTSGALTAILAADGWSVTVTESASELVARLPGASLAVFNTLRWTMRRPERYAAQAAAHGFCTPLELKDALSTHLAAGRGVLAMHTATLCFDDWDEWPRMLGACWDWDRSYHPPVGSMTVEVSRSSHELVADLDDFSTDDEAYAALAVATDVVPLASTVVGGRRQPLAWIREIGGGRVAHDALGHHGRSYEAATHRELVRRLARWATRAQHTGTPSP